MSVKLVTAGVSLGATELESFGEGQVESGDTPLTTSVRTGCSRAGVRSNGLCLLQPFPLIA